MTNGFIDITIERNGIRCMIAIDTIDTILETKEKEVIIFFKKGKQTTVFETYEEIKAKIEGATK